MKTIMQAHNDSPFVIKQETMKPSEVVGKQKGSIDDITVVLADLGGTFE